MTSANGSDGYWWPPDGPQPRVSPNQPAPSESGARPLASPGPSHQLFFPQSVVDRFGARYRAIHDTRAVEISVSLIRDSRALVYVDDRRVSRVLTEGHLQLGLRATLTGRWQAYDPHQQRYLDLPWGDGAYVDLGRTDGAATCWLYPDAPDSFILWLFVYGDGRLLPFDPAEAFPHRVDSNGALRSFVPN